MSSLPKMIELNNEGHLGQMLAENLDGERGYIYPRGDSEFVISFSSEEVTPSVEEVKDLVVESYSQLGYEVEVVKNSPPDMFEAYIFCSRTRKEEGSIYVVISTRYPIVMGGSKNHIRVTTNVNF